MRVIDKLLRFLGLAGLAVSLAVVELGAVHAQQPRAITVAEFLANPGRLLEESPNGGALLASEAQQLARADASTFKVPLGLLADASDLQKKRQWDDRPDDLGLN